MTYVYDPLATLAVNYVKEPHTRPDGIDRWLIVPPGGAFYTKDLIVTDSFSGRELQPVTQYTVLELVTKAVDATGKEVACIILIKDAQFTKVDVKQRYVGGEYQNYVVTAQQIIDQTKLDALNTTAWSQVVGKPLQFPPQLHDHWVDDAYGMEALQYTLQTIRSSVEAGDAAGFGMIYQYIDRIAKEAEARLTARLNEINQNLTTVKDGLKYEIGQIVAFSNNTNPNGVLPGVWQRLPDGVLMFTTDNAQLGKVKKIGEGPDYFGKYYAAWQRVS